MMKRRELPRTGLRRLAGLAAVLVAAGAGAGCSDAQGKPDAPARVSAAPAVEAAPVATLGTVSLSGAEVRALLAALPAAERQQAQQQRPVLDRLLQARLAEKALAQQARNQGWTEREEVRQLVAQAEEQVVLRSYLASVSQAPQAYPSAAELQAAYEQNQDALRAPARYRVSQIFLAAPYDDPEAVAKATRQATELTRRAAKSDFAALAREASQDAASAERGGDTGFVTLAQIVPELREVVQTLRVGQVSAPVQLPAGIHLLKLTEMEAAQVPPLAELAPGLREALRAQRQEQAARAYMEGLVYAGTLSVDGQALAAAIE